jgi:hypothetical protein
MNGVTTPFDKPVLSEPLPLRQAQGERWVEGLRANGDKLTGQYLWDFPKNMSNQLKG